jgi:hypothetical protein
VVVFVVLAVVAVKLRRPGGEIQEYPYDKQLLFSPAERLFLGVLDQAVGEDYRVFGKVRVADVVGPRRGMDSSSRQKALNRVSAKHFDFVLCTKGDLAVVCAVELDDQSHRQRKRQTRDALLVGLCQAVSLPLIQVPAQRAYSVQGLRDTVLSALKKKGGLASGGTSLPGETDQPEPVTQAASGTPACPNCGAPMVRRQAKAGGNAGRIFWGCSTFPKCRSVIQVADAPVADVRLTRPDAHWICSASTATDVSSSSN